MEQRAQDVLASLQREHTRHGRLPVRLAVFAPAGSALWVFIVPRGAVDFAAFRTKVRTATWHASWNPATLSRHEHARTAAETGSSTRAPVLETSARDARCVGVREDVDRVGPAF